MWPDPSDCVTPNPAPRRRATTAAVLSFCFLWLGCSSLPEYAAPKRAEVSGGDPFAGDLIPYRPLTRADFKGTEPPEAFAAVADKVGAATCARLVGNPPAQVEVTSVTKAGSTTHTGTIKNIGYQALMDRSCSWWNDIASEQDPAYVLEHEQIHFAIFEVEARRLDRDAKALAAELTITGESVEEVGSEMSAEIQELFDEASERVMDRNRDFDEDTSLGFEPERQKEWLRTVEKELAELGD